MLTAEEVDKALTKLKFPKCYDVKGYRSIAKVFSDPEKRCGIYVLHFANGEHYCGQSIRVTSRFLHHCVTHADIERISFMEVTKADLDRIEKNTIHQLEKKGFILRNIIYTSYVHGPTDFDQVMSLDEQDKWQKDTSYQDLSGERLDQPDIRRKYSRHYQAFMQLDKSAEVLAVLRAYVRTAIPAPIKSEAFFWSCSILPSSSKYIKKDESTGKLKLETGIYFRLNINWQEVFTAYVSDNNVLYSWHLASSPLKRTFGLINIRGRHFGLKTTWHYYEPGGPDQLQILIRGSNKALKLLNDPEALAAMRKLNLGLMRKGPTNYTRNHCYDLADKILD